MNLHERNEIRYLIFKCCNSIDFRPLWAQSPRYIKLKRALFEILPHFVFCLDSRRKCFQWLTVGETHAFVSARCERRSNTRRIFRWTRYDFSQADSLQWSTFKSTSIIRKAFFVVIFNTSLGTPTGESAIKTALTIVDSKFPSEKFVLTFFLFQK